MSWSVAKRPNGRATWSGTDVLFDPYKHRRQATFIGAGFAIVAGAGFAAHFLNGLVSLLLGEVLYRPGYGATRWEPFGVEIVWRDALAFFFVGLAVIGAAWTLWRASRTARMPDGWFRRAWTLSAGGGVIRYCAGDFPPGLDPFEVESPAWSVRLDQVSRVESGLTREWQPGRKYGGGPIFANDRSTGMIFSSGVLEVPSVEYQTFLFLADGSRRVIYTVNANRQSAGTLAQSIRSWIEEAKAAAKADPAILPPFGWRPEGLDF